MRAARLLIIVIFVSLIPSDNPLPPLLLHKNAGSD